MGRDGWTKSASPCHTYDAVTLSLGVHKALRAAFRWSAVTRDEPCTPQQGDSCTGSDASREQTPLGIMRALNYSQGLETSTATSC